MTDDSDREHSVWASLAVALDPVAPPASLRARLLERVSGAERYAPFTSDLAEMFDLSRERVRALLEQVTSGVAWTKGLVRGLKLIHFAAGPRIVERHAGFAALRSGFELPMHRHTVEEITFVLEGLLVEEDGSIHGPGDRLVRPPGSVHALSVVQDAVVATLVGRVEAEV
jgi:quercetin dioxygenase-like cupin family protein